MGRVVYGFATIAFLMAAPGFVHAGAAQASDAQASISLPDPLKRETVGDWVVECYDKTKVQPSCQMYQRVLFNRGADVALVMTIAADEKTGAPRLQLAVPLGIDVSGGAQFSVDNNFELKLTISRCTLRGCLVEGLLPSDLAERLRRGSSASLSVVNPGHGRFTVPFSLKGFSKAYTRLFGSSSDRPAAKPGDHSVSIDRLDTPAENRLAPVTGGQKDKPSAPTVDGRSPEVIESQPVPPPGGIK